MLKTVEERLKSYEPLWENWTYTGNFLGEGAMSSVFEIQSTAMGFREIAALKIVTVKKNHHGEVRIPENALNEIRILRALSACPNIVNYHDSTQRQIFDENNKIAEIDLLIKMEKLKALSEGERLTEQQVIKLAKDMCVALDYASQHKIIHRDIKPQNIFVDSEGTYKLGDFGIAKIISDFSGSYTMNIGTLAYTAPEIRINTTGKYDISSDIYSLGLVLYVFLNNGYLPFANTSATLNDAITKRISGAPFPSPANGSNSLKKIVMRACNADLAKRYRTPKEMMEDLELLSTDGKRLVVDPFATLDANIDVTEFAPLSGGSVPSAGIAETGPVTGGSRLKSSMRTVYTKSSDPVPPAEIKSPTPPGTGSRLKINMGKKTPPAEVTSEKIPSPEPVAPPVASKKKEETVENRSPFFKTPGSL